MDAGEAELEWFRDTDIVLQAFWLKEAPTGQQHIEVVPIESSGDGGGLVMAPGSQAGPSTSHPMRCGVMNRKSGKDIKRTIMVCFIPVPASSVGEIYVGGARPDAPAPVVFDNAAFPSMSGVADLLGSEAFGNWAERMAAAEVEGLDGEEEEDDDDPYHTAAELTRGLGSADDMLGRAQAAMRGYMRKGKGAGGPLRGAPGLDLPEEEVQQGRRRPQTAGQEGGVSIDLIRTVIQAELTPLRKDVEALKVQQGRVTESGEPATTGQLEGRDQAADPLKAFMKAFASAVGRPGTGMEDDLLGSLEGEQLSRLAKGSAGMAAVVQEMEQRPSSVIPPFEKQIVRDLGVGRATKDWTLDVHAEEVVKGINGHHALKKMVVALARIYSLHQLHPNDPSYAKAMTAHAYKAAVEALHNGGDWELAWPLTGLKDPEDSRKQVTTLGEQVALVALAKEKKMLKEIAQKNKEKKSKEDKS